MSTWKKYLQRSILVELRAVCWVDGVEGRSAQMYEGEERCRNHRQHELQVQPGLRMLQGRTVLTQNAQRQMGVHLASDKSKMNVFKSLLGIQIPNIYSPWDREVI